MKGIVHIPTTKDLTKAYGKLQSNLDQIHTKEWVLWSQWSRFDARLAEQIVLAFSKQWKKISPVDLNLGIRNQPWPGSMGVILEHVALGFLRKNPEGLFFKHWMVTAMFGVQKASYEQFFIGTWTIGSSRMLTEAELSSKPYVKWGYLGNSFLWNKKKPHRTTATTKSRLNVLEKMLKLKGRITVDHYMNELHQSVGLRQAQRDLSSHPRLKAVGNTQARYYIPR